LCAYFVCRSISTRKTISLESLLVDPKIERTKQRNLERNNFFITFYITNDILVIIAKQVIINVDFNGYGFRL